MIKAVKPTDVQESVFATLKRLVYLFYGRVRYSSLYSVRYIFTSKVCFCVLMAQIVGSCCVVKIKNDIFVSLLVCSRK